jgi:hypothetical protein
MSTAILGDIPVDISSDSQKEIYFSLWSRLRVNIRVGVKRERDQWLTVSQDTATRTWTFMAYIYSKFPMTARQVTESIEALLTITSDCVWSETFRDLDTIIKQRMCFWKLGDFGNTKMTAIIAVQGNDIFEFITDNIENTSAINLPPSPTLKSPPELSSNSPSTSNDSRFNTLSRVLSIAEHFMDIYDNKLKSAVIEGCESKPKILKRSLSKLRLLLNERSFRVLLLGPCQSGKTTFSSVLTNLNIPPYMSCIRVNYHHANISECYMSVPMDLVVVLANNSMLIDLTQPVIGVDKISKILKQMNDILRKNIHMWSIHEQLEVNIYTNFHINIFPARTFTLIDSATPDPRFGGISNIEYQIKKDLRNTQKVLLLVDACTPFISDGLFDLVNECVYEGYLNIQDIQIIINKCDSTDNVEDLIESIQGKGFKDNILQISARAERQRHQQAQAQAQSQAQFSRDKFLSSLLCNYEESIIEHSLSQVKNHIAELLEEIAVLRSAYPGLSNADIEEFKIIFDQYIMDLRKHLELLVVPELPSGRNSDTTEGTNEQVGLIVKIEGETSQPVISYLKEHLDRLLAGWIKNWEEISNSCLCQAQFHRQKWTRSVEAFMRSKGCNISVRKQVSEIINKGDFQDEIFKIAESQKNRFLLDKVKELQPVKKNSFFSESMREWELTPVYMSKFNQELCDFFRSELLKKVDQIFIGSSAKVYDQVLEVIEKPCFSPGIIGDSDDMNRNIADYVNYISQQEHEFDGNVNVIDRFEEVFSELLAK